MLFYDKFHILVPHFLDFKKGKKTISNLPPYPHLPLFQYTSLLVLLPFILPRIILALSPPRRPSPCIVWRLFSDCPCAGLLLPPLCVAPGIALQPMPGWASLWLLPALSTLSSLRQAKIH